MMRKLLFISAAFCLFFFSSCSDYNELNMQALVKFAGVDFDGEEVSVFVMCEGEKEETPIYSGRGKSFFEAVRNISQSEEKKLYWGHTEAIVFGKEALLFRLDETIDAILRARDVYLDVLPVAAKGLTAESVIKNEADGKTLLGTFVNEANSRRFISKEIWELLRDRDEFGVCIIPTVRKDEDSFVMSGGAVVSEEGVRGYLDGEEMLLLSLLTENRAGGYLPTVSPDEDAFVSFEILSNKTDEKNGKLSQKITLSPAEVKGDVDDKKMKAAAEAYLRNGYARLISRAKKENLGNIFEFKNGLSQTDSDVSVSVSISNIFGGR